MPEHRALNRPDAFSFLAVPCRICGAPTAVWARFDDTEPVLVCVTHGGARDCPGKQALPPGVRAVWERLHPDAGEPTRRRFAALLGRVDDDDAPRQLALFA